MICDDLTAESSFPTEDFYSYLHYFKDRHGLNIQNPKQQMLEVKPISTQINCIKPRYGNFHFIYDLNKSAWLLTILFFFFFTKHVNLIVLGVKYCTK